jgi:D-cysteine desulfhydrase
VADALWPILDRYPALASLPRVALRRDVTPVEHLRAVSPRLWIKRDDLTANPVGGNKVRALEFLLGGLAPGDRLVTAGSWGSTHALSAAVYGERLGARVTLGAWPQEMNDVAASVSTRLDELSDRKRFSNVVLVAAWLAWRTWRGDRVIPAGGTSPLGMLGHVNAAFELAEQIRTGVLPVPRRVVVPLGTGGTVAGLSLGFALAGVRTEIIGARVVPRIIGRSSRVRQLVRAGARLLGKVAGTTIAERGVDVSISDTVYGGAYGRPLAAAAAAERRVASQSFRVDPTYSAKALVAALESAETADTLFWLTFDSRWIPSRT